jgi:long-chain acyl-CoA synthetase
MADTRSADAPAGTAGASAGSPAADYRGGAADPIFENARTAPQRVALRRRVGADWIDVTAAQFAHDVAAAARGLIGAGLAPGDRIALMSRTRYEWSVLDIAALSIGAVVVPIYETSSAAQVQWILADSGAVALVVETAAHEATARSVLPAEVTQIWQLDAGGLSQLSGAGVGVPDSALEERRAAVSPDLLATIIYTSGTTGRPKGVQITHRNLLAEVAFGATELSQVFSPDNATLLFLPLAHVFGRAIGLVALSTGTVMGHVPDTKTLLEDLAAFQPTFVLAVPRVFEKVYNGAAQKAQAGGALKARIFAFAERTAIEYSSALDGPEGPSRGLRARHAVADHLVYGKLRAALGGRCTAAMSGGAALGDRLGHFFRGAGLTVIEGYGLTETTAAVTANRIGREHIGTVGPVVPQAQLRISPAGEIQVRGDVVFTGYWRNPDATAAAIDPDGWFSTGDLGSVDGDGYLRITGRSKEILVTAGGKNVAPAPMEDRIRANWVVGQAIVLGDGEPFVSALVTIDRESWPLWLQRAGRSPDTQVADLVQDEALRAEVQRAVDDANATVSRAESIREFRIVAQDWSEEGGQVTPSLKLKRNVVMAEHAADVQAIYGGVNSAD